ncbi:MAG: AAA family ATPase [Euryhalocaulis sp.]|uniref:ATP-dependent nuclease n=1 Tax=Euryhalocaulis sp. TaxID=2744307 RepID=UPI0017930790|nr:AAA family ATPase [Euryhalocaulis sp.]MBA4801055.1 AAA family ATPase [Euryhalocaulis sp.]
MRIAEISIENFRGIRTATLRLPQHGVLIGDNNTGKTTVLEAIDLALGPDRLNRFPPIDEHDFFEGRYLPNSIEDIGADDEEIVFPSGDVEAPPIDEEATEKDAETEESPTIRIDVTVVDLNEEQKAHFGDVIEFWDNDEGKFYNQPDPAGVDPEHISEAIRVTFLGSYEPEDDDFEGETFFTRSLTEGDSAQKFRKSDKQRCGFLYLRSVRTGSRALSLERGSLLDIILRLKELRPQMWEATLSHLAEYDVAGDPALGITGVLESINASLKKYVPKEWGLHPHLKVSNLTRQHLRKVITAFIATGKGDHAAPFYRQGTGTLNMLVLAMLSQIAEDKQNVIFAMEEPETAIPPYAQKRIVHEVRELSAQSLFTSHSPYVLEEFQTDETLVLRREADGDLSQTDITLPKSVKLKRYRQEFRTRFCEGLLARRILVAEGATETQSFPIICRRLAELDPKNFSSLESLGVCIVDAGSDSQIADLAKLYTSLGKRVFALCDKQDETAKAAIDAEVEVLFMHEEHGFEDLVLKNTTADALKRYAAAVSWPQHLQQKHPNPEGNIQAAMADLFLWGKANWIAADFFSQCSAEEIPEWLQQKAAELKELCEEPVSDGDTIENNDEDIESLM